MTKFLINIAIFGLFCFGIYSLSKFDSSITLSLYGYIIETSFFLLIFCTIFLSFIILSVIKILFFCFRLPYFIKAKIQAKKQHDINHNLIEATAYCLIGKHDLAISLLDKVENNINYEYKDVFYLVKSQIVNDFDQKTFYLRNLMGSDNYHYFAIKNLSLLFFENNLYKQAEDFAIKAFNIKENDSDILTILIHCYGKLLLLDKLNFMVSKLSKFDKNRLSLISKGIAAYYMSLAQNMISVSNLEAGIATLKIVLEYEPDNLESIKLYLKLNSKGEKSLEIVRKAFAFNPSFEIAKIYIKSFDLPAEKIYKDLSLLMDLSKNSELFLALAAYLNLKEEVVRIQNS